MSCPAFPLQNSSATQDNTKQEQRKNSTKILVTLSPDPDPLTISLPPADFVVYGVDTPSKDTVFVPVMDSGGGAIILKSSNCPQKILGQDQCQV